MTPTHVDRHDPCSFAIVNNLQIDELGVVDGRLIKNPYLCLNEIIACLSIAHFFSAVPIKILAFKIIENKKYIILKYSTALRVSFIIIINGFSNL